MRAKDIASRLTGRMRQFRATSLGEFSVALIIFAAIGTLCLPLLLSVAPTPAFAVDKVWSPSEGNSWNTSTNWSPVGVPVAADTAIFDGTTQTSPTINAAATINSITFVPGASVFSIQVAPLGVGLTLQGVGIVNNSGQTQTIINGAISFTSFTTGATAGNATTIFNSGGFSSTSFTGATAGNATIFNSGAISFTSFTTGATAGNATINNSGEDSFTSFNPGATAGNATIINSGGASFTLFVRARALGVRRLTTAVRAAGHHLLRTRPLGMRRLTTAVRAASHHLLRARPLGMRRSTTAVRAT